MYMSSEIVSLTRVIFIGDSHLSLSLTMQQSLPRLKLPPYIPFYSHGIGWQIIEITNSDRCDYIVWTPQAFEAEYGGEKWLEASDEFIKISSENENCNRRVEDDDCCCDCWLWGFFV